MSQRSIVLGVICFLVTLIPWMVARFTVGQVGNPLIVLVMALCLGLAVFVLQHGLDRLRPEAEDEIRALARFEDSGSSLDHFEYETKRRRRRYRMGARFGIVIILVAIPMRLLALYV